MASLRFERDAVVFHLCNGVDIHNDDSFGAQFRGPHARCLRFVATVARVLLTTTQDSLPPGGPPPSAVGTFTRGLLRKVSTLLISSFPSQEVRRDLVLAQCKQSLVQRVPRQALRVVLGDAQLPFVFWAGWRAA